MLTSESIMQLVFGQLEDTLGVFVSLMKSSTRDNIV